MGIVDLAVSRLVLAKFMMPLLLLVSCHWVNMCIWWQCGRATRHRCIWTDSWCKQRASQDHRRATSDTFVWIRIQDMTIINGMDVSIKFVLMILLCLRMMLRDLPRTQRKEWQSALIEIDEVYALSCLHC